MNEVEQLVIKNLLLDEEYVRKAMPFIKSEYFADTTGKKLFNVIFLKFNIIADNSLGHRIIFFS